MSGMSSSSMPLENESFDSTMIPQSVLKKAVKTAYKADFAKHSEDLAELENILATVGKLQ